MTETLPQPQPEVPAKFRDPETGALRPEALLKSYLELERKLATMVAVPGDDPEPEAVARFRRALGVPERPDDYQIKLRAGLFNRDPEVNRRLHEAGFTPAQAQLVYDLAEDYVGPVVEDMGAGFEASRQLERLTQHFGGEEKWREVARQVAAWGRANMPPEAFEALSTTAEGVLALHQMMRSGEPGMTRAGAAAEEPLDQGALDRLMRDPRYWREREPEAIAKVRRGFERLYPTG
jgi:hypothetical protein